ncbi:hypothetical protein J6X15_00995 [Candidatus Saccharibacteria bacterium]|nr:hypothetical protein [Candidatus Saccharibacteria bacterium]
MTLDFVEELIFSDGEEISVVESMMNTCAEEVGLEDFDYPESKDDMRMIRKDYVEKRLEPLVLKMLDFAAKTRDKKEVLILREYYGIHRHRLTPLEIRKNYRKKSVFQVMEIVEEMMRSLRYDDELGPWQYLLMAAMFLPAEPWRLFMRELRWCAKHRDICQTDEAIMTMHDIVSKKG